MNGWIDDLKDKRNALVGYVRRRLGEVAYQDAEDIVQDVFIGLFSRADPTIPIQDLAAFLYRALRNKIIDRLRKRRGPLPLVEDILDSGPDPSLEFERQETLDSVFAAMDNLAAEEKAVIVATEFEGRTFQELAKQWKIPMGTLLARKSRALEKIRKQLTGRMIETMKENKT
jgi:RNA polymerase sigma factor (sigma-70 family)